MKLVVVAVGHRMPAWVNAGFEEYARRMPRELALQLVEVKAEARSGGKGMDAIRTAEAQRIEAALPPRSRRVILDERGADLDTARLARRLEAWQADGRDAVFVIGGADGIDPALKATADETLRLSSLTLPHALVRPLLAEALYRAWTVLCKHPYHRD